MKSAIAGVFLCCFLVAGAVIDQKPGDITKTTEALNELSCVTALTIALQRDERIRDPDSVQIVNWTQFDANADSWKSLVTFRAKNGFGGYVKNKAKVVKEGEESRVYFVR